MTEPVPAHLAATLLLVRDGADGLEVFMVARHRQVDFASGALVFPGGRIEPEDEALGGGNYDKRERALRVGAIRETFEESGILLARPRGGGAWLDGARLAEIAARSKGVGFGELISREELELGLEALTPFAHWITPKRLPKRFDTAFYITLAPEGQVGVHDGYESVELGLDQSPPRPRGGGSRALHNRAGDAAEPGFARPKQLGRGRAESIARAPHCHGRARRGKDRGRSEARIPLEAGYGVDHFMM